MLARKWPWLSAATWTSLLALLVTQPCVKVDARAVVPKAEPARAADYVIRPMDPFQTSEISRVEGFLHQLTKGEGFKSSQTDLFGTTYWRATLTDYQVSLLNSDPFIKAIRPDQPLTDDVWEALANDTTSDLARRTLIDKKFTEDRDPITMTFFCQEFGHDNDEYEGKYWADDSAGKDVKVYIIDRGANLENPDFEDIKDRVKWIFVNDERVRNDSSVFYINGMLAGKGHGTAMLSLVAGKKYGLAPKSQPIVVRVPRNATPTDWIRALEMTVQHFRDNKAEGEKAVICLAQFTPNEKIGDTDRLIDDDWVNDMRNRLREAVSQGMLPIAGSGNNGKKNLVGWPASFAVNPDTGVPEIPELLVVGALRTYNDESYGTKSDLSNTNPGGLPHVYAPGENVRVADGWYSEGHEYLTYRTSSGTSDATASVSGLAAYLLANPAYADRTKTVKDWRNLIENLAWPRSEGFMGVFNGVPFDSIRKHMEVKDPDDSSLDFSCCGATSCTLS